MAKRKCGTEPIIVEETPGRRWYCQCGYSNQLPHCDHASHALYETDVQPIEVDVEQAGKKAICQCRQSSTLPWCDGTHATLQDS